MSTYFVFSDESGMLYRAVEYEPSVNNKFFVRGSIIIGADDWLVLKNEFERLRNRYGITSELKWSDLWILKNGKSKASKIPERVTYQDAIRFVRESLMILEKCSYCKLIYTVTFNDDPSLQKYSKEELYKMQIENLIERIEFEMKNLDKDNNRSIAVLFLDWVGTKDNQILRNTYHKVYTSGRFIKTFKHIKDSLAFDFSHQSVGIQLADYCVGAFHGVLRHCIDRSNYQESFDIFKTSLKQFIAKNESGNYMGFGILPVPGGKGSYARRKLEELLNDTLK
ncbi:MAG: DUF3800 domain-containing protein [Fervidobacterium sp.]|uniref:DUF3800 domain-containing protein n=1 Tax=Fervidobacterium sp. TaxID=1871331 RepID=UPI004049C7D6